MIRRRKSPVPADEEHEESQSSEETSKQPESYAEASADVPSKLQKTSSNAKTNDDQDIGEEKSDTHHKQQVVEAREATNISPMHCPVDKSSLSTDTLPLEPREVSESVQSQHMAELKEQATVCGDETVFSDVSCTSPTEALSCETIHDLVAEQTLHQGHQQMKEFKDSNNQNSSQSDDVTNPCNPLTSQEEGLATKGVDTTSSYDDTTTPSDVITTTSQTVQPNNQQKSFKADIETTPKEYLPGPPPCVNRATMRDSRQSGSEEIQRSNISTQEPPTRWYYNDMLVDLNNMITEKELNTMKYKFRSDPFGKRSIEKITQAMDLFTKMEEYNFLNETDITYLQALLRKLNRPVLIERTIDYCLRTDKVLHYRQSTQIQVNGYTYAKFHLYLDKEYTSDDIDFLQMKLAKILCVDVEYVCIVGVEPSHSLLVTLMLPKTCIDILVKYSGQKLMQSRLAELGIDTITIGEQVYKIEVGNDPDTRRSDEQLVSLYHQLASRDRQLDDMEKTCHGLEENLRRLKSNLAVSEDMCTQLKREMGKQNEAKSILEEKYAKRCEDLLQKIEDLKKQSRVNKTNRKHASGKRASLKQMTSTRTQNTQLQTLKQKCSKLEHSKDSLLSEISSLHDIIARRKTQLESHQTHLQKVYVCHTKNMASMKDTLKELEDGIKEKAIYFTKSAYEPTSESMQAEIASLALHWYDCVRKLKLEHDFFDEEQNVNLGLCSLSCEYDSIRYDSIRY